MFTRNLTVRIMMLLVVGLWFNLSVSAQHGQWVRLAVNNEARQEVGVAELNGKIYLIGGFNNLTGRFAVSSSVEVYDPASDRWSVVAPLPEPLHHTSAVSINGQLYVIGGYNTLSFNPVNSAYRYDPATNKWSAIARLPNLRGALASVALSGKIYTVGGEGTAPTGELTRYDPATNQWTTLASMPTAREHLAAGVINNKIYVAGGRRPGNFTLATLEEYDPAANRWTARAPMPTGRSGIAGAVVNNRLYIFGGEGNSVSVNGTFAQNESYDPATNSWRSEVEMPTPRHGIGAAVIGTRIYIPGGAPVQGFAVTNVNEAFEVGVTTPVNLPPQIEPIADQILRGGETRCLDLRVSDPENDPVTLSCAPENPAFVGCPQNNSICLTPPANLEGSFNLCVNARDSAGNSAKACFRLTVFINHPPTITPPANITVLEKQILEVKINATDIDAARDPAADGRIRLALLSAPGFVSFIDEGNNQGTLKLSPGIGDGGGDGGNSEQNYSVMLEARDGGSPALSSTAAVSIKVKVNSQLPTPIISSALFNSRQLVITGQQLLPTPQVEINGKLAPSNRVIAQSATRIVVNGNRKQLNLAVGTNQIVVIVQGVRSAPFNLNIVRKSGKKAGS